MSFLLFFLTELTGGLGYLVVTELSGMVGGSHLFLGISFELFDLFIGFADSLGVFGGL